jgi:hypothetical protein
VSTTIKHTPGPWCIEPKERVDHPLDVCSVEGARVARCNGISAYNTPDVCRANAYLIASAPELLEACRDALTDLRDFIEQCIEDADDSDYATVRKLEEAIAKAEGRSS